MSTRKVVGIALIVLGLIWTVGFPKSAELLRPDVAASISISVVTVGSGLLLMSTRPWRNVLLSIALLGSLAGNYALYARTRTSSQLLARLTPQGAGVDGGRSGR
ncbi:MAG: hypothetical protein HZA53_18020 [Planctomycetes bacterium]|nr:hypothetical protein [Planctomycetota bacterium]